MILLCDIGELRFERVFDRVCLSGCRLRRMVSELRPSEGLPPGGSGWFGLAFASFYDTAGGFDLDVGVDCGTVFLGFLWWEDLLHRAHQGVFDCGLLHHTTITRTLLSDGLYGQTSVVA